LSDDERRRRDVLAEIRRLVVRMHSSGAGPPDIVAGLLTGALGAIRGADLFTTEVWTWRGLVTYYMVFVIGLASRRVQVLGSTISQ
jgi:hypothetical protein